MSEKRLADIRWALGRTRENDEDAGHELLAELDAVTAERDDMRTAGSTRRPSLAADCESRMRAEVASWQLSEQHENCMPIDTCDKERLLREVDGLREALTDEKKNFNWFVKGVAAELGYEGEPDPGNLAQHIKGILAELARLRAEAADPRPGAYAMVERELRAAGVAVVSVMYWDRGASETITVRDGDRFGGGTLIDAVDAFRTKKEEAAGA